MTQALISWGDRRVSHLLKLTRRSSGDSIGSYRRAFKELRGQIAPMAFYVHQDWETGQVLPWQHIQEPLPQATLIKHLESAMAQFWES